MKMIINFIKIKITSANLVGLDKRDGLCRRQLDGGLDGDESVLEKTRKYQRE
jgi:hypothetical protein